MYILNTVPQNSEFRTVYLMCISFTARHSYKILSIFHFPASHIDVNVCSLSQHQLLEHNKHRLVSYIFRNEFVQHKDTKCIQQFKLNQNKNYFVRVLPRPAPVSIPQRNMRLYWDEWKTWQSIYSVWCC